MAAASNINLSTAIGQLSPANVREICDRLQLNQNWRTLASSIRRRNGSPMFTFLQIELLEQCGIRASSKLITSLVTEGYTVGKLIQILTELRLYWIADYLAVDILRGAPVARDTPADPEIPPPTPPSPIENVSLYSPEYENIPRPGPTNRPRPSPSQYDPPPSKQPNYYYPVSPSHGHHESLAACEEKSFNLRYYSDHQGGICENDPRSRPRDPGESWDPPEKDSNYQYSMLAKLTNQFDECPKQEGGHLIGRGGSSTVFYARQDDGKEIAIKRFERGRTHADQQCKNEMELLHGLEHDHILSLLGSATDQPRFICLVYPYMSNGCLLDRLACKDGTAPLEIQARIGIATALADALNFLHSKGYVHRDVKTANVLLGPKLSPKLADFGIARHSHLLVDEGCSNTQVIIGTSGYMPPESIEHTVSNKLDVYAYGVILLEILTALRPYDNKRDDPALFNHVPKDFDEFKKGNFVDEKVGVWGEATVLQVFRLARRCLLRRAETRPTMTEIMLELKESNV